METTKRTTLFWKLSGSVAGLLVLLAILVAVNVIFSGIRVRKDLTQDKLYTLSEGSRQVVAKLDQPVTLKFFFTSSAADVPGPIKTYANQVQDLLREYVQASNGRLVLETYDPQPDSDSEDWAQRYGLEGQAISQGGTTLYIGLVAVSGDTQAAIPLLDPRNEELLEYSITRLIHRVGTPQKPILGVMSSLPVMGTPAQPFMMPGQPRPEAVPAWAPFRDLSEDYTIRSVPTTVDAIEPDVDTLVVVHPKDLSDKTLFAIDQFVLRGGRLLAFVDPLCAADRGSPEAGQFGQFQRSSTLGKLFDAWGVKFDATKVVSDIKASTALRGKNNTVEYSPLYLSLRKANANKDDVITAPIENLLMVMPGAFTGDGVKGIKVTPLITTSDEASQIEAMMAQFDPNSARRGAKDSRQKLNLAVRLQGTFKTAFPGGRPQDSAAESNSVPPTASGPALAQSKTTGNVILVGDVDMLNNDFCVQSLNFFGYSALQPINDNINLFANMVEQFAGSADLIGIRCRGRAVRPFTRVIALESEAQARWTEEEQALEQKLQASQQRFDELQRQKDEKQRFVLSPEQSREIDKFRQQVLDYRQQLKQVRRNLREGIEALGMKLKAINILLMPAIVSLAGVGFAMWRRSRTRR